MRSTGSPQSLINRYTKHNITDYLDDKHGRNTWPGWPGSLPILYIITKLSFSRCTVAKRTDSSLVCRLGVSVIMDGAVYTQDQDPHYHDILYTPKLRHHAFAHTHTPPRTAHTH